MEHMPEQNIAARLAVADIFEIHHLGDASRYRVTKAGPKTITAVSTTRPDDVQNWYRAVLARMDLRMSEGT
jgi:hypothetical protein